MVFVVTTDAADGIGETSATFHGHWTGGTDDGLGFSVDAKFVWGYGVAGPNDTGEVNYATENGSHSDDNTPTAMTRDSVVTYDFRARDQDAGFIGGGERTLKTLALVMTFGAPTLVVARDTEADVNIDWNPNTIESSAYIKVQHRLRDAVTPWIDGTSQGPFTGEGVINPDFTIVGLLANTQYEYRFYASRDTANGTILGSDVGYFTTAAEPAGAGAKAIWLG